MRKRIDNSALQTGAHSLIIGIRGQTCKFGRVRKGAEQKERLWQLLYAVEMIEMLAGCAGNRRYEVDPQLPALQLCPGHLKCGQRPGQD